MVFLVLVLQANIQEAVVVLIVMKTVNLALDMELINVFHAEKGDILMVKDVGFVIIRARTAQALELKNAHRVIQALFCGTENAFLTHDV